MDSLGIVINSKAKNAASLTTYLDALSKSGIDYTLYKSNPSKLDSTIKCCIKNHSVFLIGGGDGTIRSAAQHCANTNTLLGVLPLGTMNHFAKELDLPSNADELVQAIIKKKIVTIDIAQVNGWIFVNNSSIGFYPTLAKKREYYTKFYNKWLSYIPSFIQTLQRHKTFEINIKNKKIKLSIKTSFLMISNNLYSYKFPLTAERESFNKSQLGIYFLKHGKVRFLQIVRYFFNSRHNFEIKKSTLPIEVDIIGQKKIAISLDGEITLVKTPLIYKSLPNSLKILTNNP